MVQKLFLVFAIVLSSAMGSAQEVSDCASIKAGYTGAIDFARAIAGNIEKEAARLKTAGGSNTMLFISQAGISMPKIKGDLAEIQKKIDSANQFVALFTKYKCK